VAAEKNFQDQYMWAWQSKMSRMWRRWYVCGWRWSWAD